MVLGSHPDVFYAGEAKKSRFLGDPKKPLRKRVCKLCGPDCEVWGDFVVPPKPDLYEQLARKVGAPVIADSTKDPAWIRERAREMQAAGVPHKLVFLVRDGRAVVNSRLRKTPDEPLERTIERWQTRIRQTRLLVAERPADSTLVRYEELVTEPEAVVRRLATFLGLDYDEAMLRYEEHRHHPLGGNTGTQSVVARAAVARADGVPGTFAEVPARSRDYYQNLRGGFRLDLRWKTEMPAEARRAFEQQAGEDNRAYEWEGASA